MVDAGPERRAGRGGTLLPEGAMKQRRFAAWVRGVLQDEQGAVLVEYILLAILIGLAALAGMTLLGKNASNKLNNVSANIG